MRKNILTVLVVALAGFQTSAVAQGEPPAEAPSFDDVFFEDLSVVGDITGSAGEIVPFRCPIEQIRNAYQNLVNPDDTLMALAIEKQTLAICRQSQEALIRIAENEMRLRDLFEPIMAPPPPPAEAARPALAEIFAPDPARNVLDEVFEDPDELSEEAFEEPPPPPETDFVLGVLMRDPEGRKAILYRGEQMFTVRGGETIADEVEVTEVTDGSVTIKDPDGNVFVLE